MKPARKRSKYRAKKTEVGGIKFDSKAEAARYEELCLLGRTGAISSLRCQVRFRLMAGDQLLLIKSTGFPNGRVVQYVADFVYEEGGKLIIEDVKGMETPVYKLKRAIMESMGYEIREHRRRQPR